MLLNLGILLVIILAPPSALGEESSTPQDPITIAVPSRRTNNAEFEADSVDFSTPRSRPLRNSFGSPEYIPRAHKIRKTTQYFTEDEVGVGSDSDGAIGVGDPTNGLMGRASGGEDSGTSSDAMDDDGGGGAGAGGSYNSMISSQGSSGSFLFTTASSDPEVQSKIHGFPSDSTLDGGLDSPQRRTPPPSYRHPEIEPFPDDSDYLAVKPNSEYSESKLNVEHKLKSYQYHPEIKPQSYHSEIEPYPESDAESTNMPGRVEDSDDLDVEIISLPPPKISLHHPESMVSDELDAHLHRFPSVLSTSSDDSSDPVIAAWTEFKVLPASRRKQWDYSTRGPETLSRVQGFQFCKHLNGAYFDSKAPLRSEMISKIFKASDMVPSDYSKASMTKLEWREKSFDPDFQQSTADSHVSSLTTKNTPSKKAVWATTAELLGPARFVQLVDTIAKAIFRDVVISEKINFNLVDLDQVPQHAAGDSRYRMACFMAGDGNNGFNRLVAGPYKLLRYVDGKTYFPPVSVTGYEKLSADAIGTEAKLLQGDLLSYIGDREFDQKRAEFSFASKWQTEREMESIKENLFGTKLKDQLPNMGTIRDGGHPHKLAYLVMLHRDYDSCIGVINALLDNYVTILIHVDRKNPSLKEEIQQYVKSLTDKDPFLGSRLRVMANSLDGQWGHWSLVNIELEGFFELIRMNSNWEYVINLSGADYPLRHNDVIYKHLKEHFSGRSIIEFFESDHVFQRHVVYPKLTAPHDLRPLEDQNRELKWDIVVNKDSTVSLRHSINARPVSKAKKEELKSMKAVSRILSRHCSGTFVDGCRKNIESPYQNWHYYKHHQWMILHRDFVKFLMTSPTAMYFAAFSEFVEIPDESYFSIIGMNAFTIVDAYRKQKAERPTVHMNSYLRPKRFPEQPMPTYKRPQSFFKRLWRRIKKQVRKIKTYFSRGSSRREKLQQLNLLGNDQLSPTLRERVISYAYTTARISRQKKHALHFELGQAHPRTVTMADRGLLMEGVVKYNIAFTRKLDNQAGRSEVAKEIQQIRDLDWMRVYGLRSRLRRVGRKPGMKRVRLDR